MFTLYIYWVYMIELNDVSSIVTVATHSIENKYQYFAEQLKT